MAYSLSSQVSAHYYDFVGTVMIIQIALSTAKYQYPNTNLCQHLTPRYFTFCDIFSFLLIASEAQIREANLRARSIVENR